jgi:ClpP class serine protease
MLAVACCRGKYAQLLAENKAFTPEEEALFDASAQFAYESFRDKAAQSRGMSKEAMQVGRLQAAPQVGGLRCFW